MSSCLKSCLIFASLSFVGFLDGNTYGSERKAKSGNDNKHHIKNGEPDIDRIKATYEKTKNDPKKVKQAISDMERNTCSMIAYFGIKKGEALDQIIIDLKDPRFSGLPTHKEGQRLFPKWFYEVYKMYSKKDFDRKVCDSMDFSHLKRVRERQQNSKSAVPADD